MYVSILMLVLLFLKYKLKPAEKPGTPDAIEVWVEE
jgi:hypothetical protein